MIVIKIGGAEGVGLDAICNDIAAQVQAGQPPVIVHGGSAMASELGEQLGHPPRFVTTASGHTSRYTDRRTLDIFLMATALLNRQLVAQLQALGVNAAGLSGLDGGLLQANRKAVLRIVENGKRKILRGDYTGKITAVRAAILHALLDIGITPVIAPVAISPAGEPLNVDGDRAAAEIAAALAAKQLLILTNVPGLLRNFPDEGSRIDQLPRAELGHALETLAQGRMKRKLIAAQEALAGGVPQVTLADGRVEHPISAALRGEGTVIA